MSARAPVNPEQGRQLTQLPGAEAAEGVHGHETAASTSSVQQHGGEGGEYQPGHGEFVWVSGHFCVTRAGRNFCSSRNFVARLTHAS